MNKGLKNFFLILVSLILLAGCGKKMGEKEYFDMAYQYMGEEKWSESEKYFQKILDEYPEGEFASKALFMVGFVNANYLKNYDKAQKYYSAFLEKYPDHDLADDAKYELENLGRDINDLPFLKGEETETDTVISEISGKKSNPL